MRLLFIYLFIYLFPTYSILGMRCDSRDTDLLFNEPLKSEPFTAIHMI